MNYSSKYGLGDRVEFTYSIAEVKLSGSIVGVTFTQEGVYYDISTQDYNIVRGVEESIVTIK